MASTLADAQKQMDKIVLKRLKFVLKILKALVPQSNNRNRQVHVYILEVLDAIGDWSGTADTEFTQTLDMQIFPTICRLVSTFTKDEFNSFQQFFCKYMFSKWEETSNFLVLHFLADIYGFVASIAPPSVAVELVQTFQQQEIPAPLTLIVFPALLKNVPAKVASDVSDQLSANILLVKESEVSSLYLEVTLQFWMNLKGTVSKAKNIRQLAPVIIQCTTTSFYLHLLKEKDILKILQHLIEWSNDLTCIINPEGFLLISTIFLHFLCTGVLNKQLHDMTSPSTLFMKRVVVLTEKCKNRRIRTFTTRVLQRSLEYATESNVEVQVLHEFVNVIQTKRDICVDVSSNEIYFKAMESSLKQFSSSIVNGKIEEDDRKRLRLMIDSLQKLIETHD